MVTFSPGIQVAIPVEAPLLVCMISITYRHKVENRMFGSDRYDGMMG
ncbi:hypothetical protein [Chlorobium phaeobacteroides]|jgi:hypothetical protein|nr:hypothetical protein [Chlorobium phaeobacteroides]